MIAWIFIHAIIVFYVWIMDNCYRIKFADEEFNYRFLVPEAPSFFRDFILEKTMDDHDLETTPEDMVKWAHLVPFEHEEAYLEQRLMALKLSNYLLRNHACLIHACAVIRKGRAWLFTASSGTGKTTLYHNWKRFLGEQVQILCGDMPFIKVGAQGELTVYPSPWRGKEEYGSLLQAPLGGVLYLSQGEENRMIRRPLSEIVAPLYTQFLCVSENEEAVKRISFIEESILKSVPVWHFPNRGDLDSAVVSSRTIDEFLQEEASEKI